MTALPVASGIGKVADDAARVWGNGKVVQRLVEFAEDSAIPGMNRKTMVVARPPDELWQNASRDQRVGSTSIHETDWTVYKSDVPGHPRSEDAFAQYARVHSDVVPGLAARYPADIMEGSGLRTGEMRAYASNPDHTAIAVAKIPASAKDDPGVTALRNAAADVIAALKRDRIETFTDNIVREQTIGRIEEALARNWH